ncbi:MAG: hypothetical protein IPM29_14065 [Planctomycetes bacterium]|nr:hypothetical protein [Planctomycetota bacterium]
MTPHASTHQSAGGRSDILWTLVGRMGTTAANALLMLALSLGDLMALDAFGVFVAFVGGQMLLSRIVLAGQEQAMVRLHGTGELGPEALRAGLVVVRVLGLLSVGAGLAALLLDPAWLPSGWSPWMLALGGVAAAGSAWLDVACASFLARLRYRRVGLLQAAFATVRAAATTAAAASGSSPNLPFAVFAIVTTLGGGAVLAWSFVGTGAAAPAARIRATLSYGRWITLADAAMVLALQQGVFLLMALGRRQEAGRFGFALQFAQGLFAIYLAAYHALLPRASRLASRREVAPFLRRVYGRIGLAIGGSWILAAGIAIVLPMILERLRPELLGFVPAFLGLAGFVTALLLEAPIGVSCHALRSPRLHLLAMSVRCVAIFGLGLWLVPRLGDTGAGLAQLGGATVAMALLAWLLLRALPRTAPVAREDRCAGS